MGETMKDGASYHCDSCGEEIVVPIDLTAGSRQEYVEDCPVCCCPNVIHVEIDGDSDVRVCRCGCSRQPARRRREASLRATSYSRPSPASRCPGTPSPVG